MLTKNIKTSIRSISGAKAFTLINVLGLSIAFALSFLILVFVLDDLGWDDFHTKGEDIYRVTKIWRKGEVAHYATTPAALGPALESEIPGIVNSSRFFPARDVGVEAADETYVEKQIAFADPALLELFFFPLTAGDRQHPLSEPSTALITEETARKYFGSLDPIGQTIRLNSQFEFRVVGVLADIPGNSHLRFSILLPFESLGEEVTSDWHNNSYYTYVLLDPTGNRAQIPDLMTQCLKRHVPESTSSLLLQPLQDIHLYSSHMRMRLDGTGDIRVLFGVAALGLMILIIAAANYINLSTAQIMGKCKEVWVRKWLGARRKDVFYRYMTESFLVFLLAALLAGCIAEIGLGSFGSLIGRDLARLDIYDSPGLALGIISLTLFTYLLAATYPALVLSGLNPIALYRTWQHVGKRRLSLRRTLVILQFSLASFAILTAYIAFSQYRFMDNRDPGFEETNLVYIRLPELTRNRFPSFRETLLSDASVVAVAGSASLPSQGMDISTEDVAWEGKREGEELLIRGLGVDHSFIETLGIQLIAGRNFDPDRKTDSDNYIINEAAAAAMGLDSPIGRNLKLWDNSGTIIGLVADYHYRSLRNPIQPLLLRLYQPKWLRYAMVRIGPGDVERSVEHMKQTWKSFFPDTPIQYGFVDDLLDEMYVPEKKISVLFSLLALFATVVGCLGIFGLVLFLSEQKTKEIGIRKVLGASTRDVARLLLSEIIVCILLSQLLAWPVAYFLIDGLLNNYAYRIHPDIVTFLGSTAVLVGATLGLVSYLVIKTAGANPIESIRVE